MSTCASVPGKVCSFCPSLPAGTTVTTPSLNAASIAMPTVLTESANTSESSWDDGRTATRALRFAAISRPLTIVAGVASTLAVATRIGMIGLVGEMPATSPGLPAAAAATCVP